MASSFVKVCQAQSCGQMRPLPGRAEQSRPSDGIRPQREGQDGHHSSYRKHGARDLRHGRLRHRLRRGGLQSYTRSRLSGRISNFHILKGKCSERFEQAVPCVSKCPAHINVPGYLTLVGEKRYADAIRLIRKDNPFPCVCGYVCEPPVRNAVPSHDDRRRHQYPRGSSGLPPTTPASSPPPVCLPGTGKKVAVIGGGPAGLSAAYFLQLMGHSVTVFEKRMRLGGMLRYGIPSYRLPREKLQYDLDAIIATGVQIKLNTEIGRDIGFNDIRKQYDAVFIAIGAHADKKLKIAGNDKKGRHLRRGISPRHRRRDGARFHGQKSRGGRRRQCGHGCRARLRPPGRRKGDGRLQAPRARYDGAGRRGGGSHRRGGRDFSR